MNTFYEKDKETASRDKIAYIQNLRFLHQFNRACNNTKSYLSILNQNNVDPHEITLFSRGFPTKQRVTSEIGS